MKRINVYHDDNQWCGWFDYDRSTSISKRVSKHDQYEDTQELLVTNNDRLIINSYNNAGKDFYRLADDESEIAEILAGDNFDGDEQKYNAVIDKLRQIYTDNGEEKRFQCVLDNLAEILKRYEI